MSIKVIDFLESARRTLRIERQAIETLEGRLDATFEKIVASLAACRGKVIVVGMGKSGLIGQKIASTLASTGTAAFFLHPAEASHGDLGMVGDDDLLILLSNSGETEEVVRLMPALKRLRVPMIAMTGNAQSTLAQQSDLVLDVSVDEEACPLGLAPTASTTALLAIGDAIAVALLEHKGFSRDDFAAVHPGGSLGKRLLTRVQDLMHSGDELPLVTPETPLKQALFVITEKRLGTCGIVRDGKLEGILTDGDVRRALEQGENVLNQPVTDVMTKSPKTISPDALAVEAVNQMQAHRITCLFACSDAQNPLGIIHLHDLLKAGVI